VVPNTEGTMFYLEVLDELLISFVRVSLLGVYENKTVWYVFLLVFLSVLLFYVRAEFDRVVLSHYNSHVRGVWYIVPSTTYIIIAHDVCFYSSLL